MTKPKLALLAASLCGLLLFPSLAAADCTLPAASDAGIDPGDEVVRSGNFGPGLTGDFVQIPFVAPSDATGVRIRYCYSYAAGNPGGLADTTLDIGVYQTPPGGASTWGMDQRRGWSGSAVRVIGIGENGPSDPATYLPNRRAYVPGRTTRAYQPGPIPPGPWAVELGVAYVDPAATAGVDWSVGVTFTDDGSWADDPFEPTPYLPYVADPDPGWYEGDLHVHGENEPGNALMFQTFDLGFADLPQGGGLDFMTLVDHNNDVARSQLGLYEGQYPGKLIIPGTEVTTYDGHMNSQNANQFVDFRLGSIHRFDDDGDGELEAGELAPVRGPEPPSGRMAQMRASGGWSQINHPSVFNTAPAACRGCAWSYTDQQTDFSTVDAIEIQNGPAGIPFANPVGMNPFTQDAIAFYERALAGGAHVAAVGSSDDHRAGEADGPFDASVGHAATAVYAEELSQQAVTQAIRDGHTYVKPFGADAPDVEMIATAPGKPAAMPGDSVSGSSLAISTTVTGAASGVRPGSYTLHVLRDGQPVRSVPVTGDSFTDSFTATETGRYGFRLDREQPGAPSVSMLEGYSTPIWFTNDTTPTPTPDPGPPAKPSNGFRFGKLTLNRKKGIARLRVRVDSPGALRLAGRRLAGSRARAASAGQQVSLTVKPKGKLKRTLRRKGSARAKVSVTFTPDGGDAATKSRSLKLKQTKKKAKKRR